MLILLWFLITSHAQHHRETLVDEDARTTLKQQRELQEQEFHPVYPLPHPTTIRIITVEIGDIRRDPQ
jgi:hypothetical protein